MHRRRGRGLLLTAVGVVLAAGALSLAELAVEPEHEDGAAEYVSEATATVTEPVPPPSAGTVHDGPGPVDVPTAVPVTDSHSADAGPATSAAPEDSGAPESASAPPEEPPSASTPSDPTNPSDPPDTGTPADPTPSGRPTADPTRPEPPEEPSPSPSPTETCTRWLWFCT
ncbi:hypothetical protein [Streptomyces sp. B1I3]|uniref:hypothetical protein n=1 Tax=Streptomyces sp. B1I3 TaxID=3042264 RepID=UPI0027D8BF36|nr:hypothetical protein [Streptomyces sp. B1I3]